METTEIIYLIVTVVGFLIIGYHQRYYIKALKGQIETHNKTIENLKMHVEIFQPDKIHEFVKMRETTFKDKKKKEIDKIKLEMKEKIKKSSGATQFLLDEYRSALSIISNLAYYVQPDFRQSILEDVTDSNTKTIMSKIIVDSPYYRDEFKDTLKKALSEGSLLLPKAWEDKNSLTGTQTKE